MYKYVFGCCIGNPQCSQNIQAKQGENKIPPGHLQNIHPTKLCTYTVSAHMKLVKLGRCLMIYHV